MAVLILVLVILIIAGVLIWNQIRAGVSCHDNPTAMEKTLALTMRGLAIPAEAKALPNPLKPEAEAIAAGGAHWADHCAVCHGNDGKGRTEMGRGLYPKPPDMSRERTQSLTDGELAWIIRNGVRLTGMPAWGEPGSPPGEEDWQLVLFIRHLPAITPDELARMEQLNPASPQDLEERKAEEDFLAGDGSATDAPVPLHGEPGHGCVRGRSVTREEIFFGAFLSSRS